jgi:hypothetical protein
MHATLKKSVPILELPFLSKLMILISLLKIRKIIIEYVAWIFHLLMFLCFVESRLAHTITRCIRV